MRLKDAVSAELREKAQNAASLFKAFFFLNQPWVSIAEGAGPRLGASMETD